MKIFFDEFAVNGMVKQTVNLQAIFAMRSVNPPDPNNVFVPVLKFLYSNCLVIIETVNRFNEQFIKSRIPFRTAILDGSNLVFPPILTGLFHQ